MDMQACPLGSLLAEIDYEMRFSMSLTNSQYDTIMQMYANERTANQNIVDGRFEEIVHLAPEFKDIENSIINLSIKAASICISGGVSPNYKEEIAVLEQRKKDILKKLHKPSDYLKPIFTCPLCKDTGYVGQNKCSCFVKKAVDLVYLDSNLKNITDNENFNTLSYNWYNKDITESSTGLTPFDNMHQVVHICKDFINTFDTSFSNILLFGDTGTGKTFLTNCIAKELLDSSHSVIYLTAIELFNRFEQQDFVKFGEDKNYSTHYLLDCDLLIIDDLGTELGNSYTNSKLFYVINERLLRQKSTIISTNLSLQSIREIYSERIFSRILSAYKILKLFGDDIRVLKKTKGLTSK